MTATETVLVAILTLAVAVAVGGWALLLAQKRIHDANEPPRHGKHD